MQEFLFSIFCTILDMLLDFMAISKLVKSLKMPENSRLFRAFLHVWPDFYGISISNYKGEQWVVSYGGT